MDGIAKTSLLTAAMRAVESNRSDAEGRLFSDPYAESLAGDEGKEFLQKAIAAAGEQPAIAIRTRYIDDKITEALKKGIRQIVMLAAGMDTRAYRLNFPNGTSIFELDRPEVLDYKQQKLINVQPQCKRRAIALDLREDWNEKLLQAGFQKGARTLWVVEGLLMYLEEAQVITLFERLNALSSKGDILLFDILSRTLLEVPHMKNQLEFLASLGAPWKFGINDPEKFMKDLGWEGSTSQPGEVAPDRWPFPVAPKNIPNIPRGFYVEACKI